LLEADHTDLTALTRLAELAEKEHQPAKAAELVRTKAQITELIARYRNLHDRKQPIRDAEELARIAEQLGRPFEARVFLTVAISEDPARIDLRQNFARVATRRADP
jgi:hypothetical protein